MTPRARIIPASGAAGARPVLEPALVDVVRRRIARQEIEARLAAERILREARDQADRMIADARVAAVGMAATAADEARREADTQLAARWLALRDAERQQIDREANRVLPIAMVLAERLLGVELKLNPDRIAPLALAALDEARGARRAVVDAHPLDADALREHLAQAGAAGTRETAPLLDLRSVEVRCDASLARGDLRLHTDMGIIDARLAPRFERLASALRDALRA